MSNPSGRSPLLISAFAALAAGAFAQHTALVDLPDSIAAPGTQVVWVKKVPRYCEGPATDISTGTVYWSEQREGNNPEWPIWKINPNTPSDTGTRWIMNSNQTNGLFVDYQGRVIAAQKGKIVRYAKTGAVDTVLATSGSGATFNQANDLSVGRNGAIYFTDLGSQVFYLSPSGQLKVAASGLSGANGVEWIEEENAVYVLEANGGKITRMDAGADGTLTNPKLFHSVNIPDGADLDSHGNWYVGSYGDGAVYVLNAKGERIGKITFNMENGQYNPSGGPNGNIDNCHFGDADNKTLYCTGDGGLYSIKLKIPGRAWPAATEAPTGLVPAPIKSGGKTGSAAYRPDGRFWSDGPEGAAKAGDAGPARKPAPRLPLLEIR